MSAKSFSLDHLTDTQFEEYCFDLLHELGFINIKWRKGTGLSTSPSDRGRDIECQREHVDIDGHKYFETWFVECKHSIKGVPPDKIQGVLVWATAERPDRVLIIASNFLSNASHDYLEDYEKNNKPPFKIRKWEKPDLERQTVTRSTLLRKYGIGDAFPLLSIMHPAHLLYISGLRLNTLAYLFNVLDKLEPKKRDDFLDWAYHFVIYPRYRKSVTGKETYAERRIDDFSYNAFKQKCTELASLIHETFLVSAIVNMTLQAWFGMGDTTSVSEKLTDFNSQLQRLEGMRRTYRGESDEYRDALNFVIEFMKKRDKGFQEEMMEGFFDRMSSHLQETIRDYPDRVKENRALYIYVCEHVIKELLIEDAVK